MGKTIEELFKTKVLDNGQTAAVKYEIRNSKDIRITTSNGILNATTFPLVQKLRNSNTLTARLSEKFLEEEAVGLRAIRGLASPVIYGTDIVRLKTRTTNIKTVMADAAAGGQGDNGIIGNAINKVKDKALEITSKLGIAFPETMIPTKIAQNNKFIIGKEPNTMITLAEIRNDAKGNLVGKLLKDSIKGTPKQIFNAAVGNSIQLVKDSVRKKLFGSRKTGAQNLAQQNAGEPTLYDSMIKYSSTVDASADIIAGRNDLSSVLRSREEINEKIKKMGDGGSKIQAGLENAKPSADKIENLNPFTPSGDVLKSTNKKTTENLSGARKEAQQKLAEKAEDVVDNPNVNKYDSTTPYAGTVDSTTDDIKLRNDLSTKLAALQEASDNIANGGASQNGPARTQTKLYTTLKDETKKTLFVERGISNFGDVINQKMPYVGEDLNVNGKSLDSYDFIPLKFYSVFANKTVQFRATVTGLSETVSPSWESAKFLGSPFSHYTYSGIERSVSFSFKVYSMNAAEHVIAWEKINFLTGLTYPVGYNSDTTYVIPPFIKFTLGNMYKSKECFIESLSYTIDDNTPWEVGSVGLPDRAKVTIDGNETNIDNYKLPTIVNVDVTLKFIEARGNTASKYGFIPVNLMPVRSTVNNSNGTQSPAVDPNSVPSNKPTNRKSANSRKNQRNQPNVKPPAEPKINAEQPKNIKNGEIQTPSLDRPYEEREAARIKKYQEALTSVGVTK